MVAIFEKRTLRDFDWLLAFLAIGIVAFGTLQIRNAQPTETFWVKQLIGLGIALIASMATKAMPRPMSCLTQKVSVGCALRICNVPNATMPMARKANSQSKSRSVRFSKIATMIQNSDE